MNLEPDFVDFEHAGLRCIIQRNHNRSYVGYVGIRPDHPLYGFDYQDEVKVSKSFMQKCVDLNKISPSELFAYMIKKTVEKKDGKEIIEDGIVPVSLAISVHGGITFSGRELYKYSSYDKKEREYKEKISSFNDSIWWFGFDCGHAGDIVPEYVFYPKEGFNLLTEGTYRNIEYVKSECKSLAEQLKEFKHSK